MVRSLNSRCDFKQGFFTFNLPMDTVQLVMHVETKHWKHTLKEDKEKRMEKYKPWAKWTDKDSSRHDLDSLTPSVSSDSGAWLSTPESDYKPKLFDDPRNNNSSKENMPPLESSPMPMLNIDEADFHDWTEKLLGKDNRWEAHVAQQVSLPRTSSPCPSNSQTRSLEQLETVTEDDMDVRDFSERPTNDLRPPKPPRKPKVILQNLIPPPGCPDYVVIGIPKPPLPEIRGILPEKKKVPRGWPACLKRSPPKAIFHNNHIYAKNTESSEKLYEEPHQKKTQEEQGPKEKNM